MDTERRSYVEETRDRFAFLFYKIVHPFELFFKHLTEKQQQHKNTPANVSISNTRQLFHKP